MKNKKSRVKAPSSQWKPVDVSIGGDCDDNGEESHNHYDNRELSKNAVRDLPVKPGEDVGIFLGLEVLSGDQYKLLTQEKNQRAFPQNGSIEEMARSTKKRKPSPVSSEEHHSSNQDAKKKKKEKKEPRRQSVHEKAELEQEVIQTEKEKKTKNIKMSESSESRGDSDGNKHFDQEPIDHNQISQIQQAWSQATGGALLHRKLLESLWSSKFFSPTQIQAETLSAAVLGRRNIVGAAPTGSGKTLAFLLPILNHLLEKGSSQVPIALIVTPTRELGECYSFMQRRLFVCPGFSFLCFCAE